MPDAKPFQPYDRLANRTFLGFLIAEFLAAFNDQCIHASAMFFAINSGAMTPDKAISLMPILFYSPWALFCTLAGFFADRYSKRSSLIFWKVAEVAITGIALLGFWLGSSQGMPVLGSWIVLGCVFLMGTHSAFYVPCKYGVLPEIFPPHLLSKANGYVESTSFLAVILGTTAGGVLAWWFKGMEYGIGIFLVCTATIGTLTSFLIERMPAIDPTRPFPGLLPWRLYAPLVQNLRSMFRSRPLSLALLGIAFFTFMVAFMRATMYMYGEAQNPPWEELKISLVVGVVALGIGLGSPLAGYLSGGKVELGLVPIGACGMILCTLLASFFVKISLTAGLICTLVAIGFFAGFYIVPFYTLMQHRAPKQSKGATVATSNFINVTGAILAQLVFYAVVNVMHGAGFSESAQARDVVRGTLTARLPAKSIEALGLVVAPNGKKADFQLDARASAQPQAEPLDLDSFEQKARPLGQMLLDVFSEKKEQAAVIKIDSGVREGDEVAVSTWKLRNRATGEWLTYYRVRPASAPARPAFDDQTVPIWLFLMGSLMTLMTLTALCWRLPDFFVRTVLFFRSAGRYHIRTADSQHWPATDAAVLATDAATFAECMHVLSATDRRIRFLLAEQGVHEKEAPLLRLLAWLTGLVNLGAKPSPSELSAAVAAGEQTLKAGGIVALAAPDEEVFSELLAGLMSALPAPVTPVHVGQAHAAHAPGAEEPRRIRVVFGEPLPPKATAAEVRAALSALAQQANAQPTGSIIAPAQPKAAQAAGK